jgi:shikimate kinase/3-dehydroquinate synthase
MELNSKHILAKSGKSIVLVGLMGAGKTAIGRRLAAVLDLPFFDADHEIELAAGITIAEIFAKHGEAHFRAGEKRVIQRLLLQGPIVLAPGGGAFVDPETRALILERAISIWLHCPLPVLFNRIRGRTHRPLLNEGDPIEILQRLSVQRNPFYAQADIIVHSEEDPPEVTTQNVYQAIHAFVPTRRVKVDLSQTSYEVVISPNALTRAGALMAPVMPKPRCVIVTDETVEELHLPALQKSLNNVGISHDTISVKPGESSKSLATWASLVDGLLARRVDRQTTVVALGGGVIGDLAGFAAAAALRGLPFIQIPTTLLAQVDSSVGGKTGINSGLGKNLIGAFHQPILVVADTGVLTTLPLRQRRAGYAEIVKAGLIADASFYEWCEANAHAMLAGDVPILSESIERAVLFKAGIVRQDEREEKPDNGRALLNFGHTFAHALEAENEYASDLLHGEAVAIGLVLATRLSAALGFCPEEDADRLSAHLSDIGLPTKIENLQAKRLLSHMKQDKKMRDGKLTFVLTRGIGNAFTCRDVPETAVLTALRNGGAI